MKPKKLAIFVALMLAAFTGMTSVTVSCADVEEPEQIPEPIEAINRIDYWNEHPEESPFQRIDETNALCVVVDSIIPDASHDCKKALMQLIINRCNAKGFPDSIYDVCYQKNQWQYFNADVEISADTKAIAQEIIGEQGKPREILIASNCVYMRTTENSIIFRSDWEVKETTSVYEIFY